MHGIEVRDPMAFLAGAELSLREFVRIGRPPIGGGRQRGAGRAGLANGFSLASWKKVVDHATLSVGVSRGQALTADDAQTQPDFLLCVAIMAADLRLPTFEQRSDDFRGVSFSDARPFGGLLLLASTFCKLLYDHGRTVGKRGDEVELPTHRFDIAFEG